MIHEHLIRRYNNLYKQIDVLYQKIAYQQGLSDSELDIYYTVCFLGDGCLQKDVCEIALTSKQTINSAIKKLEKANMLRLAHGKGREKHIFLTTAGKELTAKKIKPLLQAENCTWNDMTESEATQLLQLTEKYLLLLQKNTTALVSDVPAMED